MYDLKMRIYGLLIFFIVHFASLSGASIDDDNTQIQRKRQLAGTFKSHQHEPGIPEFQPGEHVEYGLRDLPPPKPKPIVTTPTPVIPTTTELSVPPEVSVTVTTEVSTTTEVSQTTSTTEEAILSTTTSNPPPP